MGEAAPCRGVLPPSPYLPGPGAERGVSASADADQRALPFGNLLKGYYPLRIPFAVLRLLLQSPIFVFIIAHGA